MEFSKTQAVTNTVSNSDSIKLSTQFVNIENFNHLLINISKAEKKKNLVTLKHNQV